MKVVIKLFRRSIACIVICILFSSSLMVAQSSLASITNVTNRQVSYSTVNERLCNTLDAFISSCYGEDSFSVSNYNAPIITENVHSGLQFSVTGFSYSVINVPLGAFVKVRRSASPVWMMQEKNLLKQAFC